MVTDTLNVEPYELKWAGFRGRSEIYHLVFISIITWSEELCFCDRTVRPSYLQISPPSYTTMFLQHPGWTDQRSHRSGGWDEGHSLVAHQMPLNPTQWTFKMSQSTAWTLPNDAYWLNTETKNLCSAALVFMSLPDISVDVQREEQSPSGNGIVFHGDDTQMLLVISSSSFLCE